jgi:chaperonin cofactor prefoldin
LHKFLQVLADHRRQLESQLREIEANLDELTLHEKEARALLAKHGRKTTKATA